MMMPRLMMKKRVAKKKDPVSLSIEISVP